MAVNDLALSWKDHHGVLISVFEKLLEKKTLVDCTLAAEGKFLKAHKIVLSACSPYLEALLNQENDKHPIIFLRDVHFEDLKTLVEFVYSGEIKIPEDRLVEFLSVAEALQIKGLGGAENEANSKKSSTETVRRRETSSPLPRKRSRRHSVEKDSKSRDKEAEEVTILDTPSPKSSNESQLRISDISSIPSASMKPSTTTEELTADIQKVKEEVQNVLTGVSVSIRREQVSSETSTEEILGLKPEFEQVTFTEDYSDDLLPEDSDSVEPVMDQNQPSSSHQYSGFSAEPVDSGGLAIEQPYLVAGSEQQPAEGSGSGENSWATALSTGPFWPSTKDCRFLVCSMCPKTFKKKYSLQRHERLHRNDRPFRCSFCPSRFDDSWNLSTHMRIHTGERPFRCTVCGKASVHSSNLKKHMLTHAKGFFTGKAMVAPGITAPTSGSSQRWIVDSGSFVCSVCNKSFMNERSLLRHKPLHDKERPFSCSFCASRFKISSNLTTHMRLHTGERPYRCYICEKAFAHSSNLKTHMLSHTNDRPFKCHMCSMAFKNDRALRIHTHTHSS